MNGTSYSCIFSLIYKITNCWDVFCETFVFGILLEIIPKTFLLKCAWVHLLPFICIPSKHIDSGGVWNIRYICSVHFALGSHWLDTDFWKGLRSTNVLAWALPVGKTCCQWWLHSLVVSVSLKSKLATRTVTEAPFQSFFPRANWTSTSQSGSSLSATLLTRQMITFPKCGSMYEHK